MKRWTRGLYRGTGNVADLPPPPNTFAPGVRVSSSTSSAICPDLLDIDDIGVADNARGRTVRGFFRLLAWVWPVR